jgi:hypothetical protein
MAISAPVRFECDDASHEGRVAKIAVFFRPPGQEIWATAEGDVVEEWEGHRKYRLRCDLCGLDLNPREETLFVFLDSVAGLGGTELVEDLPPLTLKAVAPYL